MKSPVSPDHIPAAAQWRFVGVLAAGLLLPLLAGCPGTVSGTFPPHDGTGTGGMIGGGTGGMAAPPCDAPAMVLQKDQTMGGCSGAVCHSTFIPKLDPMMAPASGLKAALAGASAAAGPCMGQKFVDMANPAASVLLKRVQGSTCGDQMPSNYDMPATKRDPLSADLITCIAGWIANP